MLLRALGARSVRALLVLVLLASPLLAQEHPALERGGAADDSTHAGWVASWSLLPKHRVTRVPLVLHHHPSHDSEFYLILREDGQPLRIQKRTACALEEEEGERGWRGGAGVPCAVGGGPGVVCPETA